MHQPRYRYDYEQPRRYLSTPDIYKYGSQLRMYQSGTVNSSPISYRELQAWIFQNRRNNNNNTRSSTGNINAGHAQAPYYILPNQSEEINYGPQYDHQRRPSHKDLVHLKHSNIDINDERYREQIPQMNQFNTTLSCQQISKPNQQGRLTYKDLRNPQDDNIDLGSRPIPGGYKINSYESQYEKPMFYEDSIKYQNAVTEDKSFRDDSALYSQTYGPTNQSSSRSWLTNKSEPISYRKLQSWLFKNRNDNSRSSTGNIEKTQTYFNDEGNKNVTRSLSAGRPLSQREAAQEIMNNNLRDKQFNKYHQQQRVLHKDLGKVRDTNYKRERNFQENLSQMTPIPPVSYRNEDKNKETSKYRRIIYNREPVNFQTRTSDTKNDYVLLANNNYIQQKESECVDVSSPNNRKELQSLTGNIDLSITDQYGYNGFVRKYENDNKRRPSHRELANLRPSYIENRDRNYHEHLPDYTLSHGRVSEDQMNRLNQSRRLSHKDLAQLRHTDLEIRERDYHEHLPQVSLSSTPLAHRYTDDMNINVQYNKGPASKIDRYDKYARSQSVDKPNAGIKDMQAWLFKNRNEGYNYPMVDTNVIPTEQYAGGERRPSHKELAHLKHSFIDIKDKDYHEHVPDYTLSHAPVSEDQVNRRNQPRRLSHKDLAQLRHTDLYIKERDYHEHLPQVSLSPTPLPHGNTDEMNINVQYNKRAASTVYPNKTDEQIRDDYTRSQSVDKSNADIKEMQAWLFKNRKESYKSSENISPTEQYAGGERRPSHKELAHLKHSFIDIKDKDYHEHLPDYTLSHAPISEDQVNRRNQPRRLSHKDLAQLRHTDLYIKERDYHEHLPQVSLSPTPLPHGYTDDMNINVQYNKRAASTVYPNKTDEQIKDDYTRSQSVDKSNADIKEMQAWLFKNRNEGYNYPMVDTNVIPTEQYAGGERRPSHKELAHLKHSFIDIKDKDYHEHVPDYTLSHAPVSEDQVNRRNQPRRLSHKDMAQLRHTDLEIKEKDYHEHLPQVSLSPTPLPHGYTDDMNINVQYNKRAASTVYPNKTDEQIKDDYTRSQSVDKSNADIKEMQAWLFKNRNEGYNYPMVDTNVIPTEQYAGGERRPSHKELAHLKHSFIDIKDKDYHEHVPDYTLSHAPVSEDQVNRPNQPRRLSHKDLAQLRHTDLYIKERDYHEHLPQVSLSPTPLPHGYTDDMNINVQYNKRAASTVYPNKTDEQIKDDYTRSQSVDKSNADIKEMQAWLFKNRNEGYNYPMVDTNVIPTEQYAGGERRPSHKELAHLKHSFIDIKDKDYHEHVPDYTLSHAPISEDQVNRRNQPRRLSHKDMAQLRHTDLYIKERDYHEHLPQVSLSPTPLPHGYTDDMNINVQYNKRAASTVYPNKTDEQIKDDYTRSQSVDKSNADIKEMQAWLFKNRNEGYNYPMVDTNVIPTEQYAGGERRPSHKELAHLKHSYIDIKDKDYHEHVPDYTLSHAPVSVDQVNRRNQPRRLSHKDLAQLRHTDLYIKERDYHEHLPQVSLSPTPLPHGYTDDMNINVQYNKRAASTVYPNKTDEQIKDDYTRSQSVDKSNADIKEMQAWLFKNRNEGYNYPMVDTNVIPTEQYAGGERRPSHKELAHLKHSFIDIKDKDYHEHVPDYTLSHAPVSEDQVNRPNQPRRLSHKDMAQLRHTDLEIKEKDYHEHLPQVSLSSTPLPHRYTEDINQKKPVKTDEQIRDEYTRSQSVDKSNADIKEMQAWLFKNRKESYKSSENISPTEQYAGGERRPSHKELAHLKHAFIDIKDKEYHEHLPDYTLSHAPISEDQVNRRNQPRRLSHKDMAQLRHTDLEIKERDYHENLPQVSLSSTPLPHRYTEDINQSKPVKTDEQIRDDYTRSQPVDKSNADIKEMQAWLFKDRKESYKSSENISPTEQYDGGERRPSHKELAHLKHAFIDIKDKEYHEHLPDYTLSHAPISEDQVNRRNQPRRLSHKDMAQLRHTDLEIKERDYHEHLPQVSLSSTPLPHRYTEDINQKKPVKTDEQIRDEYTRSQSVDKSNADIKEMQAWLFKNRKESYKSSENISPTEQYDGGERRPSHKELAHLKHAFIDIKDKEYHEHLPDYTLSHAPISEDQVNRRNQQRRLSHKDMAQLRHTDLEIKERDYHEHLPLVSLSSTPLPHRYTEDINQKKPVKTDEQIRDEYTRSQSVDKSNADIKEMQAWLFKNRKESYKSSENISPTEQYDGGERRPSHKELAHLKHAFIDIKDKEYHEHLPDYTLSHAPISEDQVNRRNQPRRLSHKDMAQLRHTDLEIKERDYHEHLPQVSLSSTPLPHRYTEDINQKKPVKTDEQIRDDYKRSQSVDKSNADIKEMQAWLFKNRKESYKSSENISPTEQYAGGERRPSHKELAHLKHAFIDIKDKEYHEHLPDYTLSHAPISEDQVNRRNQPRRLSHKDMAQLRHTDLEIKERDYHEHLPQVSLSSTPLPHRYTKDISFHAQKKPAKTDEQIRDDYTRSQSVDKSNADIKEMQAWLFKNRKESYKSSENISPTEQYAGGERRPSHKELAHLKHAFIDIKDKEYHEHLPDYTLSHAPISEDQVNRRNQPRRLSHKDMAQLRHTDLEIKERDYHEHLPQVSLSSTPLPHRYTEDISFHAQKKPAKTDEQIRDDYTRSQSVDKSNADIKEMQAWLFKNRKESYKSSENISPTEQYAGGERRPSHKELAHLKHAFIDIKDKEYHEHLPDYTLSHAPISEDQVNRRNQPRRLSHKDMAQLRHTDLEIKERDYHEHLPLVSLSSTPLPHRYTEDINQKKPVKTDEQIRDEYTRSQSVDKSNADIKEMQAWLFKNRKESYKSSENISPTERYAGGERRPSHKELAHLKHAFIDIKDKEYHEHLPDYTLSHAPISEDQVNRRNQPRRLSHKDMAQLRHTDLEIKERDYHEHLPQVSLSSTPLPHRYTEDINQKKPVKTDEQIRDDYTRSQPVDKSNADIKEMQAWLFKNRKESYKSSENISPTEQYAGGERRPSHKELAHLKHAFIDIKDKEYHEHLPDYTLSHAPISEDQVNRRNQPRRLSHKDMAQLRHTDLEIKERDYHEHLPQVSLSSTPLPHRYTEDINQKKPVKTDEQIRDDYTRSQSVDKSNADIKEMQAWLFKNRKESYKSSENISPTEQYAGGERRPSHKELAHLKHAFIDIKDKEYHEHLPDYTLSHAPISEDQVNRRNQPRRLSHKDMAQLRHTDLEIKERDYHEHLPQVSLSSTPLPHRYTEDINQKKPVKTDEQIRDEYTRSQSVDKSNADIKEMQAWLFKNRKESYKSSENISPTEQYAGGERRPSHKELAHLKHAFIDIKDKEYHEHLPDYTLSHAPISEDQVNRRNQRRRLSHKDMAQLRHTDLEIKERDYHEHLPQVSLSSTPLPHRYTEDINQKKPVKTDEQIRDDYKRSQSVDKSNADIKEMQAWLFKNRKESYKSSENISPTEQYAGGERRPSHKELAHLKHAFIDIKDKEYHEHLPDYTLSHAPISEDQVNRRNQPRRLSHKDMAQLRHTDLEIKERDYHEHLPQVSLSSTPLPHRYTEDISFHAQKKPAKTDEQIRDDYTRSQSVDKSNADIKEMQAWLFKNRKESYKSSENISPTEQYAGGERRPSHKELAHLKHAFIDIKDREYHEHLPDNTLSHAPISEDQVNRRNQPRRLSHKDMAQLRHTDLEIKERDYHEHLPQVSLSSTPLPHRYTEDINQKKPVKTDEQIRDDYTRSQPVDKSNADIKEMQAWFFKNRKESYKSSENISPTEQYAGGERRPSHKELAHLKHAFIDIKDREYHEHLPDYTLSHAPISEDQVNRRNQPRRLSHKDMAQLRHTDLEIKERDYHEHLPQVSLSSTPLPHRYTEDISFHAQKKPAKTDEQIRDDYTRSQSVDKSNADIKEMQAWLFKNRKESYKSSENISPTEQYAGGERRPSHKELAHLKHAFIDIKDREYHDHLPDYTLSHAPISEDQVNRRNQPRRLSHKDMAQLRHTDLEIKERDYHEHLPQVSLSSTPLPHRYTEDISFNAQKKPAKTDEQIRDDYTRTQFFDKSNADIKEMQAWLFKNRKESYKSSENISPTEQYAGGERRPSQKELAHLKHSFIDIKNKEYHEHLPDYTLSHAPISEDQVNRRNQPRRLSHKDMAQLRHTDLEIKERDYHEHLPQVSLASTPLPHRYTEDININAQYIEKPPKSDEQIKDDYTRSQTVDKSNADIKERQSWLFINRKEGYKYPMVDENDGHSHPKNFSHKDIVKLRHDDFYIKDSDYVKPLPDINLASTYLPDVNSETTHSYNYRIKIPSTKTDSNILDVHVHQKRLQHPTVSTYTITPTSQQYPNADAESSLKISNSTLKNNMKSSDIYDRGLQYDERHSLEITHKLPDVHDRGLQYDRQSLEITHKLPRFQTKNATQVSNVNFFQHASNKNTDTSAYEVSDKTNTRPPLSGPDNDTRKTHKITSKFSNQKYTIPDNEHMEHLTPITHHGRISGQLDYQVIGDRREYNPQSYSATRDYKNNNQQNIQHETNRQIIYNQSPPYNNAPDSLHGQFNRSQNQNYYKSAANTVYNQVGDKSSASSFDDQNDIQRRNYYLDINNKPTYIDDKSNDFQVRGQKFTQRIDNERPAYFERQSRLSQDTNIGIYGNNQINRGTQRGSAPVRIVPAPPPPRSVKDINIQGKKEFSSTTSNLVNERKSLPFLDQIRSLGSPSKVLDTLHKSSRGENINRSGKSSTQNTQYSAGTESGQTRALSVTADVHYDKQFNPYHADIRSSRLGYGDSDTVEVHETHSKENHPRKTSNVYANFVYHRPSQDATKIHGAYTNEGINIRDEGGDEIIVYPKENSSHTNDYKKDVTQH
ncbi:unnamed protein product [Gordionus sp. m RMFG-2023]|uniref:uncharacterized protein LOC135929000 n=1 Tax=Gordionus sp. m RMFG-2023 TaxID=3053472 RepID=UPI0030E30520